MAGIIAEHTSGTESEYQLSRRQRQIWDLGGLGEVNKQVDSGRITTQEQIDTAMEKTFIRVRAFAQDRSQGAGRGKSSLSAQRAGGKPSD